MWLEALKSSMSFYLVIPLTVVAGSFLTWKFRALQLRNLANSFRILTDSRSKRSQRGISAFSALTAYWAATWHWKYRRHCCGFI